MKEIDQIKEKIRTEIVETMNTRGISQAELARLMNLSRQAINNYLVEKFDRVSISKLVEICTYLDLKVKVEISSNNEDKIYK